MSGVWAGHRSWMMWACTFCALYEERRCMQHSELGHFLLCAASLSLTKASFKRALFKKKRFLDLKLVTFIWCCSLLLSRLTALLLHVTVNEWLSLFTACFEYPHKGCSCSTVWFLHGWFHSKLLHLSTLCVRLTTMHQITSFHANHVPRVHACLAITGHLHLWQNDQDFLHATAVSRGWNRYRNKSTESWPRRGNISRCSCQDSNLQPFDHKSSALTTELSPLPFIWSL